MEKVNVDANEVLKHYRSQVDELNFENTVLRLQLAKRQQAGQQSTKDENKDENKGDK